MLHRREVVDHLLAERPENLLVVSGLGSPTWDVLATGDDERNFAFIGAMGQAAPFALGLAMAQPQKRVLLITGDGELLMGLGALATIGTVGPANLSMVVLDNEAYAETGAQPTATAARTDLVGVAQACGVVAGPTVRDLADLADLRARLLEGPAPMLSVVKIMVETLPKTFPFSFDGVTSINRFRAAAME